jgi:tetratricopeptide (TPR) repeat protein
MKTMSLSLIAQLASGVTPNDNAGQSQSPVSPTASADRIKEAIERVDGLERNTSVNAAIADLRREVARSPDADPLRHRLASLFEKRGDPGSAIVEARRAVELEPENAYYQNTLAWNLCLAGLLEAALPHARKAAELQRGSADIQDTLAHAEYSMGHWREAAKAWSKLDPGYFNSPGRDQCAEDREHFEEAKRKAAQPPSANPEAPPDRPK